jgi:TPR repeat protein
MNYGKGWARAGIALGLLLVSGSLFASQVEGLQAYERGQFANALQFLLPLANEGDAVAQYHLGLMYEDGKGVRADPVQARQWFEKAAQVGHAEARFRLGRIHADGRGVPADGVQASRWYLLAAGQGNLDAQYSLGTMFKLGRGVPPDPVQAYLWFDRAAEQGLGNARVQRDFLIEQLSPEQLEEARQILAGIEQARLEAEREAEQERLRRAREAEERKAAMQARQEAAQRAQEEAARRAAEDAARQEAERQARQAASANQAQLEQERRTRELAEEQARVEERKQQAANSEREQLQAIFVEGFERDAEQAAARLRNFHADEVIIASQLLSVDELSVSEMNDGTGLVYVRYTMQKLQRGDEESVVREASKWFKVRRAESGIELINE